MSQNIKSLKKFAFYFKYAWRAVRRDRSLSVFAVLCVAVGVGTLVALQSLTISIQTTLVGDIQTRAGGDVVANVNFSRTYQSTLSPKATQLFDKFKAQGRVTDWTGLNSHSVQITGYFNVPPTVYIVDPAHFPLYGDIPTLEPKGGNFRQLLSEPNTIIISKSLWKANNYQLGQQIEVSGLQDFTQPAQYGVTLKIVGVIDPVVPGINFDSGLFVGFGITSQQTALNFLDDAEVTPTTFYFKTAPGVDPQPLIAELKNFNQSAPANFPFFSQTRTAPEVLGESTRNLEMISQILLYIGLLAIFIGGLGCINTMLVVVGRRTTEIATLKALGLKSAQAILIFTLQVTFLGALGSLVGLGMGSGLGYLMKGLLESLFSRPFEWGFYPVPLLTGLVVGTLVSALFGFLPAYAAGRVRPAVVLRQSETTALPHLGNLPASGIILGVTVALGLVAGTLLGDFELGILVALVTLLVSLLLIALMYGIIYLIGRLPVPFGPSLKLALRNFNRYRTRSATTLMVITISLFFISLITIVSDSVKATLKETFDFNLGFNAGAVNVYSKQDEQLQARFEQEIPGLQRIFISNDVGANLLSVNGQGLNNQAALNDPLCGAYLTDTRFGGPLRLKTFIQLSGRSLAKGESISPNGPQKVLAGRTFTPADMDQKVLLVSEEEARCYSIKLGDKVTLRLRSNNFGSGSRVSGPVDLTVIGIVSKGTAGTNFEQGFVTPFQVVNQAGAQFSIFFMQIDPPQVKTALTKIQTYLYGDFVFDLTDLIDTFTNLVNQVLAFPLLLSLLSLFSGSILIANNVALAVVERRTEVGVLKAIGAKRSRVLKILLWESSLLGLVGGLLGISSSLLVVVLVIPNLVKSANRNLNLLVSWSPVSALLLIGLGIFLALSATILSSWRALQEKPLVVLRYE
jgi:predicted lysophospholipase L1 biosynthesis ABC-type transport system permease subunit